MTSWNRYPSPKALGHAMVRDVLNGPVVIQEKTDGSQFSFGVFDGELRVRSRGAVIDPDVGEKMFNPGIEYVKKLNDEGKLVDGFTYTGEFFNKPKHNTLAYERIPKNGIMLFDVRSGNQEYVGMDELRALADDLEIEAAAVLFEGNGNLITKDRIDEMMNMTSVLGGDFNQEGIVIKNYTQFCADGTVQMAKVVSEKFKEKHQGNKNFKTNPKDIIHEIATNFNKEAIWNKAVQHLSESGTIAHSPTDIGPLMKEVNLDVQCDNEEEIRDALFRWAWPKISREITRGLPPWYKEKLENTFWKES